MRILQRFSFLSKLFFTRQCTWPFVVSRFSYQGFSRDMIIPRLDFKALTIIAFQPSRLSTIKSWKTVFLAKYKIAITRLCTRKEVKGTSPIFERFDTQYFWALWKLQGSSKLWVWPSSILMWWYSLLGE